MTIPPFPQTVIAVVWDFDKTLIPDYMQKPLFAHYEVEELPFWDEVRALPTFYRAQGVELVSRDTLWLNHILAYVRAGRFPGLSNKLLRELGQRLHFYAGLPAFLPGLKARITEDDRFHAHGITVEHYIVSTGLRQTILGSAIAEHVDGVWGCEFSEATAEPGFNPAAPPAPDGGEIQDVVYVIDNTTKTRAVFEINKGVNKFPDRIDVNATMPRDRRRVPFENMIYVADGPSDVPVFSLLNQYGGRTYAVYRSGSEAEFRQARALLEQGRVQGIGEADYTEGRTTALWLTDWTAEIAGRIVERREQALGESVAEPPEHIHELKPKTEAPHDEMASSGGPLALPEEPGHEGR